jgi:cytochrome P450
LLGLHRNEKLFPQPKIYDMNRFSEDKKAYDEDMYMPFGVGPRNRIGMNFYISYNLVHFQSL